MLCLTGRVAHEWRVAHELRIDDVYIHDWSVLCRSGSVTHDLCIDDAYTCIQSVSHCSGHVAHGYRTHDVCTYDTLRPYSPLNSSLVSAVIDVARLTDCVDMPLTMLNLSDCSALQTCFPCIEHSESVFRS